MSYSEKHKIQALKYLEAHTYKETSEVFGVSFHALTIWKRKAKNNESLKITKRSPYGWKICTEALECYVIKHSDQYQYEIAIHFGCTQQAICYALKKLEITRKKRVYPSYFFFVLTLLDFVFCFLLHYNEIFNSLDEKEKNLVRGIFT